MLILISRTNHFILEENLRMKYLCKTYDIQACKKAKFDMARKIRLKDLLKDKMLSCSFLRQLLCLRYCQIEGHKK